MLNITATEAGRHFGKALATAKTDPVFISRNGKQVAALISFDALQRLVERGERKVPPAEFEKLVADFIEKRRGLLSALVPLG